MKLAQVTVFGASGFIGRHVVRRLAAEGVRVVAAVRDPHGASFLQPMGNVGQIVPVACDVRREDDVARVLQGSDGAVNLVGILYQHGGQGFDALHADAPGRMARLMSEAGVERFVHISANGADPESNSAYARSKAAGESAAREALAETVVLRPSIVFGPEDDFFNRFASLARISPALPLFGGGRTRFQPVYAGDVADAVWAGLSRRRFQGGTFVLGGPKIYTFRELMELILQEIRRRRLLVPLPMLCGDLLGVVGDVMAKVGLKPPITRDQARMLRVDNVVPSDARGLDDLGIEPKALELELPLYLDRFRPAGRYDTPRA